MSVTKVNSVTSPMGLAMYAAYGRGEGAVEKINRNDLMTFIGTNRANTAEDWGIQAREDWLNSVAKQVTGRKRSVEAYHVIQSWSTDELDPNNPDDVEKAHAAGVELSQRLAPHAPVMVATQHDGRSGCVHNHIVLINADLETGKALPGNVHKLATVRYLNDQVMRDFGMQVLNPPEMKTTREERKAIAEGVSIESDGL